jgi:hypothetical protein
MEANKSDQKILDTLEHIKRLLILGLTKNDVKGKEIATVLEVDPAVISRTLSGKKK